MSADIALVSFSNFKARSRSSTSDAGRFRSNCVSSMLCTAKSLAEVVVKLTRDAGALFLLRMDQVAAQVATRHLHHEIRLDSRSSRKTDPPHVSGVVARHRLK